MQCKNCKYIFEDNEKNYYLCPNCLELIEENLPDDKRKRVEIYEISLVYKDKLYNKLINFTFYFNMDRIVIYSLSCKILTEKLVIL